MKTVDVHRDVSIRVNARAFVQYRGGVTYRRVPEMQARAIVAAGAGAIVGDEIVVVERIVDCVIATDRGVI